MQHINKLLLFFLLFFSVSSFGQSNINGFKTPRLSPLPATVVGIKQPQISLNGTWDFQVIGYNKKHTILVPGEWEMQGYTVNEGETAVYSKALDIPADWQGKRIKLRFDGVSSHAVIKVNGTEVCTHEGSFVQFEADITDALKSGSNLLQVEVQANTISDKLACTSQYAVHTVGGILRKVVLFVLPKANIASNANTVVFDQQFKNADLNIRTSVANESATTSITQVRYVLTDATGKVVFNKLSDKSQKGSDIITKINIAKPQQWNPEHPYLYYLKSILLVNGKAVQSVDQHVGFRQVEVKGNEVFVNGKSIKLHGVNRHSVYPLTGRSISPELDRKDAELFRDANCNYIRTSHYPPSE